MMTVPTTLRFGTRGSALARRQTQLVVEALQRLQPGLKVETVVIRTTGDQWAQQPGTPAANKGMFTKELEESLLADHIDLAVHSLKDLPVENHPGLGLAAIPGRANPQDVLISRAPLSGWSQLPRGAVVATGSLRRSSQLLAARPDLQVVDIRGNIDTRVRKLRENPDWAGLVLAAAGLDRLQPELAGLTVSPFDFSVMLPAPGQGAVALQSRIEDARVREAVAVLHCRETAQCVGAERAFLLGLGGGCQTPVGAYAQVAGETLFLRGILFSDAHPAGSAGSIEGAPDDADHLGRELARQLQP